MKGIRVLLAALLFSATISACAGLSTREQRVLSGAAIGAGAGAATSLITGGNVAAGSAIGAGAGAIGGFIVDEMKRK
jgi:osmotically inducible lipoprotein OsmB